MLGNYSTVSLFRHYEAEQVLSGLEVHRSRASRLI
jgi:hypothetical protein